MNKAFRERSIPGVIVDSDGTSAKHDSIVLRESTSQWRAGNRLRLITARPLAEWLLSDWHHKRRLMGLPDLDFEPVKSGLFYSLRLGGVWVAADWWLSYFQVDQSVIPLRLSHLAEDVNRWVLPLLPEGQVPFRFDFRENARPQAGDVSSSSKAHSFSSVDLERLRHVNPRWSSWEATWSQ